MMDSYTFANFMNAGSLNQGGGLIFTEDLMQDMLDWQAAGGGSTGGSKKLHPTVNGVNQTMIHLQQLGLIQIGMMKFTNLQVFLKNITLV